MEIKEVILSVIMSGCICIACKNYHTLLFSSENIIGCSKMPTIVALLLFWIYVWEKWKLKAH